jgi:leucyl aminopeptidase
MRWGRTGAPKVTLVGKGVCFDTGGLNLKRSGMLRMKKDMGGAAQVLGLADMIMTAGLDVRLRVLIGAVENSVSGNAYHPSDVIRTRKGITVEVGNTDAEGRLVMCDALAEADREKPALIVDCATLTGAARTAVGTEIAALFCNDEVVAGDLLRHGVEENDPLWRLPLWAPYRSLLDSKVADINNVSDSGPAGAITAALFLQEFVSPTTPWVHLDIMGWNTTARPGRPVGGEAMGMRALYALIAARLAGPGRRRTKRQ